MGNLPTVKRVVGWHCPFGLIGMGHDRLRYTINRALYLETGSQEIQIVPFRDRLPVNCELVIADIDYPAARNVVAGTVPIWTLLRWMPAPWCESAFANRPGCDLVFTTEPFVPFDGDVSLLPVIAFDPGLIRIPQLGSRLGVTIHSVPHEAYEMHYANEDHFVGCDNLLILTPGEPTLDDRRLRAQSNRVVSAYGYSSFWETIAHGWEDKTRFVIATGDRRLNDQPARAKYHSNCDQIRPVRFNGAETFVGHIMRYLDAN